MLALRCPAAIVWPILHLLLARCARSAAATQPPVLVRRCPASAFARRYPAAIVWPILHLLLATLDRPPLLIRRCSLVSARPSVLARRCPAFAARLPLSAATVWPPLFDHI
ncbi:hypothetical protein AXF42_Ash020442 [Apostasia shenzhenica]|uniref:Secreted protein n=1 Tax=Apostasia shenzhenica TaxID=1088818 RepID=A0A2H9ZYG4_9ASPA|nr:hypothetical protein AXF42_Ash020442 [Apostasia shenzhenica]